MKLAVQEMVRERLLECLEVPSETEFTQEYILVESHSYRLSPLGVLYFEELLAERVLLAAAGWELPFQNDNTLKSFVGVARSFKGDANYLLDRNDVALLCASRLPEIVAEYLLTAQSIEESPSSHFVSSHEVAAAEEGLHELCRRLQRLLPMDIATAKPAKPATSITKLQGTPCTGEQLRLIKDGEDTELMEETIRLPPPKSLRSATMGKQSTNGPMVLWALACARANGLGPVSGTHIAKLINDHIVDDQHRVESTNISRLLRSPTMTTASWLIRVPGKVKDQTLFELGEGWRDAWHSIFSEDAPDL